MKKHCKLLIPLIITFIFIGCSKDENELQKVSRKALAGDNRAQFDLGYMYHKGDQVSRNLQQAIQWYTKSADQGNPQAQRKLAQAYQKGKGREKNLRNAIDWYTKAAKRGYSKAQFDLGELYGADKTVRHNLIISCMWFKISALYGYKPAVTRLEQITKELNSEEYTEADNLTTEWLKNLQR